jgi:hypothetical protein
MGVTVTNIFSWDRLTQQSSYTPADTGLYNGWKQFTLTDKSINKTKDTRLIPTGIKISKNCHGINSNVCN